MSPEQQELQEQELLDRDVRSEYKHLTECKTYCSHNCFDLIGHNYEYALCKAKFYMRNVSENMAIFGL